MKNFNIINVLIALVAMVVFSSCGGGQTKEQDTEVMVFAAASLTDVLSELVKVYEAEADSKIKLNLASSGTLARQIVQGGEADLYVSASKKWADYIDSLGFVKQGYKAEIARNELVLITPISSGLDSMTIDNNTNFTKMLGKSRLSIGDPSHVPAGKYAKQSLDYFNFYDGLKDRLLPSKDVRSALMMVELAEAPLGIVYKTDALKSGKVDIVGIFPEESHKPVVYVAEVCNLNQPVVQFYEFLTSPKALPVWQKYGFKK